MACRRRHPRPVHPGSDLARGHRRTVRQDHGRRGRVLLPDRPPAVHQLGFRAHPHNAWPGARLRRQPAGDLHRQHDPRPACTAASQREHLACARLVPRHPHRRLRPRHVHLPPQDRLRMERPGLPGDLGVGAWSASFWRTLTRPPSGRAVLVSLLFPRGMGSRNTRTKAAASGTRQAQAVICSAYDGRWWPKAEKKIVPRTATPSEVESCCTASRTPEADPTSFMFTLVRMNRKSCPMLAPTPAPIKKRPGTRSQVEAPRVPARISASPAAPAAISSIPIWSR